MDWIAIGILWVALSCQVQDNQVQDAQISYLIGNQADSIIRDFTQDIKIEELKNRLDAEEKRLN